MNEEGFFSETKLVSAINAKTLKVVFTKNVSDAQ